MVSGISAMTLKRVQLRKLLGLVTDHNLIHETPAESGSPEGYNLNIDLVKQNKPCNTSLNMKIL